MSYKSEKHLYAMTHTSSPTKKKRREKGTWKRKNDYKNKLNERPETSGIYVKCKIACNLFQIAKQSAKPLFYCLIILGTTSASNEKRKKNAFLLQRSASEIVVWVVISTKLNWIRKSVSYAHCTFNPLAVIIV